MSKIVDFNEFLIKEGLFNFKTNKLKKKIQQLLLNKDHSEMFLFFSENKDLVGDTKNLSTEDMINKLTDLLFDLSDNEDNNPYLYRPNKDNTSSIPPNGGSGIM